MKSVFAPVAAALLFAASTVAQLTINTPISPVVCQPLLINWSGGTPPYFLSILPGNQPTAPAVLDFGQQSGTSITWIVNITAGTSLGLNLRDSTGTLAQSAAFTIQASSNTACLTASTGPTGSSSGGGGGASSTPGVVTTTPVVTPTTTPATGASPVPSTTNTKPASVSSPAPSASKSASASAEGIKVSFAGALGAALLALLA